MYCLISLLFGICAEGALECGARGTAFDNGGALSKRKSGVADAAVQSFLA